MPANTERRAIRNAAKPITAAPTRTPTGISASAPVVDKHKLRQDAREHRGRHRPHPDDDLRLLVEPAHQKQPGEPPDLVRQEADQQQGQSRPDVRDQELHGLCLAACASRQRWTA